MIYYLYKLENSLKFDKCGATTQWDVRYKNNKESHGSQCIITLLETMEGPNEPEFWQMVGDREWELADLNGYPRGTHYKFAREQWGANATTHESCSKGGSIGGPIGGRKAGQKNVESGHLASIRTKENQSKGGRKNVESGHLANICPAGGRAAAASPKSVNKQKRQCPYCDKVSTPGAIGIHVKYKH
jgi:hypothetical protein